LHYRSRSYTAFSWFNYTFILGLSILCILPLIHIFAVSLSAKGPATANMVNFWPVGFTLNAYHQTFGNANFIRALTIGVERTVLGTIISLAVNLMAAYALSKSDLKFKGRSFYAWYFVFIMLFNGGLIPTYLVISGAGLYDSIWALIIPSAVNTWNMILMMNFFRSLPGELEDASLIDGAGHFRTLFQIFIPISLPGIATVGLFTMVTHWNSWFDGIIYLTHMKDYPLASFLQTIIVNDNLQQTGLDAEQLEEFSNRTVKASQIFIGALPILFVYPFLQKYFVKGMVLGSVKE
jgi:putative aldouronate transport system permease protein